MKNNLEIVKRQLGRKRIFPCETVSCCSYGFPIVIRQIPSERNLNVKTLFWLTCPYANRTLAGLEEQGFIREFSEFLKNNRKELSIFASKYRKARNEILKRYLPDTNIPEDIQKAGIGGVKDDIFGKCLHAHIAFYLIDNDYFPGRFIKEKAGNLFCDGNQPVCQKYMEEENA